MNFGNYFNYYNFIRDINFLVIFIAKHQTLIYIFTMNYCY
jgi:hypothetical protein